MLIYRSAISRFGRKRVRGAEIVMADEKKPKGILNIPSIASSHSRPATATPRPTSAAPPIRTQEQLRPLALRIAENADLMQRFRAVIGSEDQERASEVSDEIRRFAQGLDSSVTFSEGTRIVVILMGIVGHPKGRVSRD